MHGDRVARHLLDRGRITAGQLEEAQRTQSFFGGEVESYLLRLGFVDEATVGDTLTEVFGVPFASAERLRSIPVEALAAVAPEAAGRLALVPFHVEDRRLRVAMLNPRDARAIAEVQGASGYRVEPWITTEHRLDQALERHYRVRRAGRPRVSLAVPTSGTVGRLPDPPPAERPREEPGPALGLDGRPLDAEVSFDYETYATMAQMSDLSEGGAPAQAAAPRAASDPVEGLDAALASAADRDAMAEALLDFCATRSSRSALFAVGREGIRGLAGRGPGMETDRVRKIVLPPGGSTILDAALRSRDFHFGVVPALPPNRDLYSLLGGRLPAMALVVPIAVKERIAALLYLDDGDRAMTRPDIPLLRRVAAKAGLASEILLLRNKLRRI